MSLDVRTIVVMLVVSSVLMTVTLALGTRSDRGHGFVRWNTGLALVALGWLLVTARGMLPDLIAKSAADALLLAGLCSQLAAVLEFGGARPWGWLQTAPAAALFAVTLPLMDDYALFTLATGAGYCAAFVATGLAAARLGSNAGPARWMLAGSYLAAAAVLAARTVLVMSEPAGSAGLFSASALHALAFLMLFVATSMGSLAFLLMLRERAEGEIRRLAMFDALTGLYNRGAFMDLAERELARARRSMAPVAVLMLDLDNFKRVNDDFGHQAGDRVLKEFSALAGRCLRAGDLLGRYGGEEFCAVLPGATPGQALAIAERIRLATAERPIGRLPRPTTISVGIANGAAGVAMPLDAAIARADKALYRAKNEGRNRVNALDLTPVKPATGLPKTIEQNPQTRKAA